MLNIKCKVKKSELGGKGLYSEELIPKGKIIGILAQEALVMSEEKYQKVTTHSEKKWLYKYSKYVKI